MDRFNNITLYCGNHQYIPPADKASMIILSQVYETPLDMSKKGANLLKHLCPNGFGWDRFFFTNNDHVLNGLRVAVMEHRLNNVEDICHRIKVVYFDPQGKRFDIKMNRDGRLNEWPVGFFDQIENDLMKLF